LRQEECEPACHQREQTDNPRAHKSYRMEPDGYEEMAATTLPTPKTRACANTSQARSRLR
jgi:hypothetical protein